MSCMWGVGGVNGFSCCGGDIEDYYRQAEPQLMAMAPTGVRKIQSEFRLFKISFYCKREHY